MRALHGTGGRAACPGELVHKITDQPREFTLEIDTRNPNMGDVCRYNRINCKETKPGSGTCDVPKNVENEMWTCPIGCVRTANFKSPYCVFASDVGGPTSTPCKTVGTEGTGTKPGL